MKEHFYFFKQFFKKPQLTGAIAPSSDYLAKKIVCLAKVNQADLILEFGPGTGVFTQQILQQKKEGSKFVAIEKNPDLIGLLYYKFTQDYIEQGCVEDVENILAKRGITNKADCIVSGLPWAAFDNSLQDRLLKSTYDILRKDGVFTTFAYVQGAYLSAGRSFRKKIESLFSKVEKSPIIWRNLPPAFVYKCIK